MYYKKNFEHQKPNRFCNNNIFLLMINMTLSFIIIHRNVILFIVLACKYYEILFHSFPKIKNRCMHFYIKWRIYRLVISHLNNKPLFLCIMYQISKQGGDIVYKDKSLYQHTKLLQKMSAQHYFLNILTSCQMTEKAEF